MLALFIWGCEMPYKDKEKQREYQRKWVNNKYATHTEEIKKQKNDNRNKKRQWLNDYKAECGCFMCGIKNPVVLEMHHKDPSTKRETLAYLTSGNWSLDVIKEEAEKCEVVCANCHRIIHHNERESVPV